MVDGLFCAKLTDRRGGNTPFIQAGAETPDTGAEAVQRRHANCDWMPGIHCLAARSRLSQISWYALSIFDVPGGGNLSTDSPVRRQSTSNRSCESSNASPDRCGQEPWILLALWGRTDVVTAGTILEHVCPAVGCPGRTSRRPGLYWCRHSNGEKRNWLFPLACTTVQGCWIIPTSPGSHHQRMLCCNPSWHAGSWGRQHTDGGMKTTGWSLGRVARVEVCKHWWSYMLRRLRTTTQSLIVLETDRPVTIPTARGQMW